VRWCATIRGSSSCRWWPSSWCLGSLAASSSIRGQQQGSLPSSSRLQPSSGPSVVPHEQSRLQSVLLSCLRLTVADLWRLAIVAIGSVDSGWCRRSGFNPQCARHATAPEQLPAGAVRAPAGGVPIADRPGTTRTPVPQPRRPTVPGGDATDRSALAGHRGGSDAAAISISSTVFRNSTIRSALRMWSNMT
jgi:hypothetical protein